MTVCHSPSGRQGTSLAACHPGIVKVAGGLVRGSHFRLVKHLASWRRTAYTSRLSRGVLAKSLNYPASTPRRLTIEVTYPL